MVGAGQRAPTGRALAFGRADSTVEPTEAAALLPVWHLAPRMLWPNEFEAKIEDARHFTSLRFPA